MSQKRCHTSLGIISIEEEILEKVSIQSDISNLISVKERYKFLYPTGYFSKVWLRIQDIYYFMFNNSIGITPKEQLYVCNFFY